MQSKALQYGGLGLQISDSLRFAQELVLCKPQGIRDLRALQTRGLRALQTEGIAKQSFAQEICVPRRGKKKSFAIPTELLLAIALERITMCKSLICKRRNCKKMYPFGFAKKRSPFLVVRYKASLCKVCPQESEERSTPSTHCTLRLIHLSFLRTGGQVEGKGFAPKPKKGPFEEEACSKVLCFHTNAIFLPRPHTCQAQERGTSFFRRVAEPKGTRLY